MSGRIAHGHLWDAALRGGVSVCGALEVSGSQGASHTGTVRHRSAKVRVSGKHLCSFQDGKRLSVSPKQWHSPA
jgi:hypothetical protein